MIKYLSSKLNLMKNLIFNSNISSRLSSCLSVFHHESDGNSLCLSDDRFSDFVANFRRVAVNSLVTPGRRGGGRGVIQQQRPQGWAR